MRPALISILRRFAEFLIFTCGLSERIGRFLLIDLLVEKERKANELDSHRF